MRKYSYTDVYIQLICVENGIWNDDRQGGPPSQYLKWKRHYLLQRLLEMQLREFNRD